MRKKIFLICPVRKVTKKETTKISQYVTGLEIAGNEVYWPYRDTDQADKVGLRICSDNISAMEQADEIHFWWKKGSEGSICDLGATLALLLFMGDKKIVIANPENVWPTESKSFMNVLSALHNGLRPQAPVWSKFRTITTHRDLERAARRQ